MGAIFTKAMTAAAKEKVDCSIMNSGSGRIDDQLSGTITAVDIFRCLPYGGPIYEVEMKGELLSKVLQEGEAKNGKGAYLQRNKVSFNQKNQHWQINGEAIDPLKNYRVMLTDYLLKGLDIVALKEDSPGIVNITRPQEGDEADIRRDIRLAVIEYLKGQQD